MFTEITKLDQLKRIMIAAGAKKLYFKYMAPNDNSKNQIYLGGNFDILNIIPFGEIKVDSTISQSGRDRMKAELVYYWIDAEGRLSLAPHAQLILYPKYPEVRMSGFLSGCEYAPSEYMTSRESGRIMFLGVTNQGKILGHICGPNSPARSEIERLDLNKIGIFHEIPILGDMLDGDDKNHLLEKLRYINAKGWIPSQRLNKYGELIPCHSSNCGGYTLEACFGILPNGYAEPDYLGWELKQHNVRNLDKPLSGGAITLMTPEPTGGIYKDAGVVEFIERFGYSDLVGRESRWNFGGIYKAGKVVKRTCLRVELDGYVIGSNKLDDIGGGLVMLDKNDNLAAEWSFVTLLDLWKRKHAKAVYIPSLHRLSPQKEYYFGHLVEMGEGTDFFRLLDAIGNGDVYLDPALKLVMGPDGKKKTKRRNQFRIKPSMLGSLYHKFYQFDLRRMEGQ